MNNCEGQVFFGCFILDSYGRGSQGVDFCHVTATTIYKQKLSKL